MKTGVRRTHLPAVLAVILGAAVAADTAFARGGRFSPRRSFSNRSGSSGRSFRRSRGPARSRGIRRIGGVRNRNIGRIGKTGARKVGPKSRIGRKAVPRKKSIGKVRGITGIRNSGRGFGRSRGVARSRRFLASRWRRWAGRSRSSLSGWGIGKKGKWWRKRFFLYVFVFDVVNGGYENPYCQAGDFESGGAGECYDYSQPVCGDYGTTDGGINQISDSSDAFYEGDYDTALKQADKAVKEMPKNPDMHQFRSLVLFAQKRYREAAMAAHPALVSGKGWNWKTLRSFYPSTEAYTAQLRSLEKFTADNPKNAAGQFLLGYHYMMLGHGDAAGKQLATVVKLEPKDKLAARMLVGVSAETGKSYGGNDDKTPTTSKNEPATQTPKAKAGSNTPFNPIGNWKATIKDGSTVNLTIEKGGKFRWSYNAGGQTFAIGGTWTLKNGQMKLQSPKEKEPLEGALTSTGNNAFQLAMKDAPKNEAALTFKRQ